VSGAQGQSPLFSLKGGRSESILSETKKKKKRKRKVKKGVKKGKK